MVEQIDLRKNMESNKNRIANSYSFFMHLHHLTIYVMATKKYKNFIKDYNKIKNVYYVRFYEKII